MKAMLVAWLAVGACGGTVQPSPIRNGTVPPSTAAAAERDLVEAQLPGDALAILYEASGSFLPIDCPAVGKLGASFEVVQPGNREMTFYVGDFQRAEVTKCLLADITLADPGATAVDEGDTTTIKSGVIMSYLTWHPHYMALTMSEVGKPPPELPPPSATQITAFHALRGAKVALWSRLPFMKMLTGVDAPEPTVMLDAWDMPAEWHRAVSGTITARFASAADARAAAAEIAAGHLATVTDPALIAAAKGLKVEVSDTTLRATVTDFTFDPRDLEKQLAPVLEHAK